MTASWSTRWSRRACSSLDDPVASTSRATTRQARARSRSATFSRTAPGCRTSRARRSSLDYIGDREYLAEALRDAKPFARAGQAPRLPRRLGRVHPRRARRAGHGQVDPRRSGRGVPRPARLSLDELRGRARGRRRGRAELHDRRPGPRRRSRRSSRARWARRSTELVETTNDDRFVTGDRAGRRTW